MFLLLKITIITVAAATAAAATATTINIIIKSCMLSYAQTTHPTSPQTILTPVFQVKLG